MNRLLACVWGYIADSKATPGSTPTCCFLNFHAVPDNRYVKVYNYLI